MNKFFKKYYKEILSTLIPTIIFLIACLINHYHPFGNKTLALFDANGQYTGFFSYFREVLLGNESILYSFKGLLGYNFFATSAYYLFNPSNILLIFFDKLSLINFYTLIVLFRISLSGLTICKYLKYKFKKENNYIILFSVAYALMAYNVSYFHNFMYFDSVVLFPLVMIGIEKILKNQKPTHYIITLTLSIISNFYIGYMICIFSVIYFIYNYYLLEKKNKKIIKTFIISSLLSGFICAFLLIPTIYELLQGKAELFKDKTQTDYFSFNLNFINFFYKMTPGSIINYDMKYGTVNIYCTLLVLTLVIKYLLSKEINIKEKKATLALIIFFLISISFNLIDFSWHMFQRPIWYPNRYIFTFSFLLITIAYKSLLQNKTNTKILTKIIILIILLYLITIPAINAEFYKSSIKIICYIFSILLIIQYLFINNKKLFILLFFIEISLNTIVTLQSLQVGTIKEDFIVYITEYDKLTNYIKNKEKDNDFYRVEYQVNDNRNMGATFQYNGLNYFNSLKNGKVIKFFYNKLNYTILESSVLKYDFQNPYINTLLGVKYFNAANKEDYYESNYIDGQYLYENKDAFPLIFNSSDNILQAKLIDDEKLENINKIVNGITGNNNKTYYKLENYTLTNLTFKESDITKIEHNKSAELTYEAIAKEDGFMLLNQRVLLYNKASIIINNKEENHYIKTNVTPIFIKKGDHYKITYTPIVFNYEKELAEIYFLPYSTYENFVNSINRDFKITEYKKDNKISGTISPEKDNELYLTTIPYDKGWVIKLDNKQIDYDICLDTFICFKANKSNKNIELSYTPIGLKLGTIISLITLIITIIYIRKK